MRDDLCCAQCFGDAGLRESIIPSLSATTGDCQRCGASQAGMVEPEKLRPWLEMLVGVYEVDEGGRPLLEWLRRDWRLFSNPHLDDSRANSLLAATLENHDIVTASLSPSRQYDHESLSRWDDLRDEMMHRNRWFLDEPMDLDRLRQLLDLLLVPGLDFPARWFRARLMADEDPYPITEMGAPPHRLARHGRANPAGIPYLYLASTPATAVAEVRPHTGEGACVAEFTIPSLRAVDLRSPRDLVSPFILSDSEEISLLRADLPLLERLGDELTRPVLPRGTAVEYIPSQYLCEYIKKCGFEGVVYRSSVGDGINLAAFDPEVANPGSVVVHRVARVSVELVRAAES